MQPDSPRTTLAGVRLQASLDDFFRVMARWRLTQDQQRELLGGMSSDTYAGLAAGTAPDIQASVSARITTIAAIDRAVVRKLGNPEAVPQWFWMANSERPFLGAPPLALMLRDRAGLSIVANYLKCEAR
jgi:hypothetical protein